MWQCRRAALNQTLPPFDNAAIRRATLSAVSQRDFMSAIGGGRQQLWHDKVGFFAPARIWRARKGWRRFNGPRDLAAAAKAIKDAGYRGETVLLIAPATSR